MEPTRPMQNREMRERLKNVRTLVELSREVEIWELRAVITMIGKAAGMPSEHLLDQPSDREVRHADG